MTVQSCSPPVWRMLLPLGFAAAKPEAEKLRRISPQRTARFSGLLCLPALQAAEAVILGAVGQGDPGPQVARLVEERVAHVLDSDAVKQSLQARLVTERKVRRAIPPPPSPSLLHLPAFQGYIPPPRVLAHANQRRIRGSPQHRGALS